MINMYGPKNISIQDVPVHGRDMLSLLRFLKKLCTCQLKVNTLDETMYILQFVEDDKVWKLETIQSNGLYLLEYRKQINRFMNRITDITNIVITSVDNAKVNTLDDV